MPAGRLDVRLVGVEAVHQVPLVCVQLGGKFACSAADVDDEAAARAGRLQDLAGTAHLEGPGRNGGGRGQARDRRYHRVCRAHRGPPPRPSVTQGAVPRIVALSPRKGYRLTVSAARRASARAMARRASS